MSRRGKAGIPVYAFVALFGVVPAMWWVHVYGDRIPFLETETIATFRTWAFFPLLALSLVWRGTRQRVLRHVERSKQEQEKKKKRTETSRLSGRDSLVVKSIGAAALLALMIWYFLTPVIAGMSSLFLQSRWSDQFVVEGKSGTRSAGPRIYYYLYLKSLDTNERFTVPIQPTKIHTSSLQAGNNICVIGYKNRIGKLIERIDTRMEKCRANFNTSFNTDAP